MAKKKRATFATRLLDLILPPKKKKKKKKRRVQVQGREPLAPQAQQASQAQSVALRGLERLKAHSQARQGQRAADALSAVGGPLAALEAALGVIDTIQALVREAEELIGSAREGDLGRRALLAERYDDIRLELDRIIRESGEGETPLIGQNAKGISIAVGTGRKAVAIRPINLETGEEGIDLPPPESAFEENDELDLIERKLLAFSGRIARAAEVFVADAALLSNSIVTSPAQTEEPAASALTHR
jgi:hypothetical protein